MENKKINQADKQKLLEAFSKRLPRMTAYNLRLLYIFATNLQPLDEAVDILSEAREG